MRGMLASGLAGVLALPTRPSVAKPMVPEGVQAFEVASHALTRFRPWAQETRFGALAFVGGLQLTSPFSGFGGISGLHLDTHDGRLLMVTDAGLFLSGRLECDGLVPRALSGMRASAVLDSKGRAMARSGRGDVESLASGPQGVFIGVEGVNEIWRFPGPDPLGQRGSLVPVPPGVKKLGRNLGLESLALIGSGPRAGTLIAIGEAGPSPQADLPGFLISGSRPGSFTIAKSWRFNATDADIGPDGRLYLLERHFSLLDGVSMQIRRFALDHIVPGARLEGEVLIRADMRDEIDNMEGLTVTTGPQGEIVLTLVSDDNFSAFQRTLLLRFVLAA